MRERCVPDGLDFGHVENPQIPLPLLEPIQRVMVRADVGWRGDAEQVSTKAGYTRVYTDHAPVAQGIEHPPPKRGAASSILAGRAIFCGLDQRDGSRLTNR